ncbi:Ger(x)C family spore germination protein [Oceanobacillus profundus]|uniref:Ger(X)C family spore germination protein n=1 Tax=Oceanobacillus profundus TaxID=372463 RepID=A0A417YCW4_9BACI|nr:Ger(x)C family spore germination protein [Oceanobacillus profundus]RHW30459.1 Ger(x)C family spore germination protein [Oceanobacillus profundus]
MNKRLLIHLCWMMLLLSGCWDENDIEERGFVIGTAIDLVEDQQANDNPTLKMTNQFVVPAGIGLPTGAGSEKKAFTNLSKTGESLFEIIRLMSTAVGRAPYYEHLKLIVVSEEVARQPDLFAGIMDLFIRDQEMRREMRVVISEDKAQKILEIEPETENLPVMYITNVMENTTKLAGLIDPARIGEIHEHLLEPQSYVIPRVFSSDDKIIFNGGAVFHGESNRLVGTINLEEAAGLNLIKNKIEGGYFKIEVDNKLMVYELKRVKSNIEINANDPEDINIEITIDAEGNIGEMFGQKSLLDKAYLSKIERKVSERIEQVVNNTIKKAQEDLKLDFFGFSEILKRKHYEIWNEVKENWDEGDNIFANSTVKVKADAIIRTTGATDRVKDQGSE